MCLRACVCVGVFVCVCVKERRLKPERIKRSELVGLKIQRAMDGANDCPSTPVALTMTSQRTQSQMDFFLCDLHYKSTWFDLGLSHRLIPY